MIFLGWALLVYGFGVLLVLPLLPGISAVAMEAFSYDIRLFTGLQAIVAGTSVLRHPKPLTTLAVLAAATIPLVLLLRADHLWWAAAVMALQGIPLWLIHRKPSDPASTPEDLGY